MNKVSNVMKNVTKSVRKNKTILYVLFALSILVILGFLSLSKLEPVLVFVLTGLIVRYKTKNMIYVLFASICASMLYVSYRCVREGLENNENDDDDSDDDENEKMKHTKDKDEKSNEKESTKCVGSECPESMRPLRPKSLNDDDEDDSPYIDTATTLGQAYKNFEDILGSDGITKLSEETKKLAKQQTHLVKAMNQMGPMVKQMSGVMKDVNGDGNMKNTLGQMQNMLKGLSK